MEVNYFSKKYRGFVKIRILNDQRDLSVHLIDIATITSMYDDETNEKELSIDRRSPLPSPLPRNARSHLLITIF